MRGSTDPDETLGAQQLKSGYHSVRLWKMQAEVKRYARDLLRLVAAVMCQKFGVDTFQAMTDLKLPTAEQKQLLQQMAAMQQQSAPPPNTPPQPPMAPGSGAPGVPPGQPPQGVPAAPGGSPPVGAGQDEGGAPPDIADLLKVPTWEDCMALMHSPSMRQFRIDVETDSTISGTIDSDMSGLSEVLSAIAAALKELGPLVTTGVLPAEAAKQLIMTIIRRSRMGSAVEDAFDKMQKPPPQPDPKAAEAQAKAAADVQSANAKAAADVQKTQAQEATKQHTIDVQAAHDDQQQQRQIDADKLAGQAKLASEQQLEQMRQEGQRQREQFAEAAKTEREQTQALFDGFIKIITATISATKQPDEAVQPKADAAVAGA